MSLMRFQPPRAATAASGRLFAGRTIAINTVARGIKITRGYTATCLLRAARRRFVGSCQLILAILSDTDRAPDPAPIGSDSEKWSRADCFFHVTLRLLCALLPPPFPPY